MFETKLQKEEKLRDEIIRSQEYSQPWRSATDGTVNCGAKNVVEGSSANNTNI